MTPQALVFHQTHSRNIKLSDNDQVATRVDGYCDGVCFSNRPIAINERVRIKFKTVSKTWNSIARFGFTTNDPARLRSDLPKYACPDLTNQPGYWAKALAEQTMKQGTVAFFYVTKDGAVIYGLDDKEVGLHFSGVATNAPLWFLMDIYGNTEALEFQQPKGAAQGRQNLVLPTPPPKPHPYLTPQIVPAPLVPTIPVIRSGKPAVLVHNTHSKNIEVLQGGRMAKRLKGYCDGICFSNRTIAVKEPVTISFASLSTQWNGSARFGFTSKDPADLRISDIPKYSCPDLVSKPGYWAMALPDDAAVAGNSVIFQVCTDGSIVYCINKGETRMMTVGVPTNTKLWAMVDLYGKAMSFEFLDPDKQQVLNNVVQQDQAQEIIVAKQPVRKQRHVKLEEPEDEGFDVDEIAEAIKQSLSANVTKPRTRVEGVSKARCEEVPLNSQDVGRIHLDCAEAGLEVVKIYNVQNDFLQEKFEFEAAAMKRERPDLDLNIKELYHGTTAARGKVCEEGLDERLGKIGHFGRGIYFSDNPMKCMAYAGKKQYANADDNPYMLLCKVILGDSKIYKRGATDKNLKREPVKEVIDQRSIYYDSVQGLPRDRKEFVIYEKRRALIQYIIHYQQGSNFKPNDSVMKAPKGAASARPKTRDRSLKKELQFGSWKLVKQAATPNEDDDDNLYCDEMLFDEDEISEELGSLNNSSDSDYEDCD